LGIILITKSLTRPVLSILINLNTRKINREKIGDGLCKFADNKNEWRRRNLANNPRNTDFRYLVAAHVLLKTRVVPSPWGDGRHAPTRCTESHRQTDGLMTN